MFGKSDVYKFDNKTVMRELQSMGANDLHESLLNGLEDVHDMGTPVNPHPDGAYEPPELPGGGEPVDEFGLGDTGLEAPEPMVGQAEPGIIDQIVDAGIDRLAPLVDDALGAIPGFDAITSAINKGAASGGGPICAGLW